MRRRQQHHRLLGNGWCERPAQMDCHYETMTMANPGSALDKITA